MKNFIPRNESFVCESCGTKVPPAQGTFRNHCISCLSSKHVDQDIPGDRQAICQGLMPAIAVEGVDPDKLDLIHRCLQCDKTIRNRLASDDDKEAVFRLFN